MAAPQDDHGRENERACDVAQPPSEPNRIKLVPGHKTTPSKTRYADRRADRRSQGRANQCENADPDGRLKRPRTARPVFAEIRTDESLERIAYCNTYRRVDGACSRLIRQQSCAQNCRPNSEAP